MKTPQCFSTALAHSRQQEEEGNLLDRYLVAATDTKKHGTELTLANLLSDLQLFERNRSRAGEGDSLRSANRASTQRST
jgi:hypothetical protein